MKARCVATLAPDSIKYPAPAIIANPAANFFGRIRNAKYGNSANAYLNKAKTNPESIPMCKPEIANKWARLDARKLTRMSGSMSDRSPVMIAAAKAPFCPSMCCLICVESFIRNENNQLLMSGSDAVCEGITGLRVYPIPPSLINHAIRLKSKPLGSTGGLGGEMLAVSATWAPAIRVSSGMYPCNDNLTRSGVCATENSGRYT